MFFGQRHSRCRVRITGLRSPNHVTITATEFTAPSIGSAAHTIAFAELSISAQLNQSRLLDNLKATMYGTTAQLEYGLRLCLCQMPIIDPQVTSSCRYCFPDSGVGMGFAANR